MLSATVLLIRRNTVPWPLTSEAALTPVPFPYTSEFCSVAVFQSLTPTQLLSWLTERSMRTLRALRSKPSSELPKRSTLRW